MKDGLNEYVNAPVRKVGTIDLTPTWTGVLPIIIYALENGSEEGRRMAKLELATMAEAADRYNAMATCKPTMTDDEIKNSNTPEAQAAARERMK